MDLWEQLFTPLMLTVARADSKVDVTFLKDVVNSDMVPDGPRQFVDWEKTFQKSREPHSSSSVRSHADLFLQRGGKTTTSLNKVHRRCQVFFPQREDRGGLTGRDSLFSCNCLFIVRLPCNSSHTWKTGREEKGEELNKDHLTATRSASHTSFFDTFCLHFFTQLSFSDQN